MFEEDIEKNVPENEKRLVKRMKKQLAVHLPSFHNNKTQPVVEKKQKTPEKTYDLWETPKESITILYV